MSGADEDTGHPGASRRLDSWKRIALYLGRDVRTVQRWEASENLPVHRLGHRRRDSVFAYADELDAWLHSRASIHGAADTGSLNRRAVLAVAAVVLVLAGATAVLQSPGFSGALRPDDKIMLAVLPLENLNGSTEGNYFSDGLTEDLITALGRMNPERLGVIARTSILQYRATEKGVAQIGRELSVDYILEGTVRREGERLRLTAQLIDVSDQTHRWAHSYDRSIRAVLDLQTELASEVARAIRVELVVPPGAAREAAAIDPQTYELLLLGRHHLHRWMPEGFVAARDYLTRAVERDPDHSAAQAWLAMAYLGIAFYEIEPRRQAYANASAAARAALDLNPLEGQALVVLGFEAYAHDWNWPLAEQYFRRALEVSPNSPWPHWGYAHLLDSLGRHEEAIAESRLALRLDPASLFMHYARQFVLWNAGNYDEAFAACEDARERMPDRPRAWYQCAKEVYERTGQYERAIEMRAGLSELGSESGYYYKIEAGSRDIEALRLAWRERGAPGYWAWVKALRDELGSYHAVNRAAARAQLGEIDEAIVVLEDGFARRDQSLTALGTEPLLDPLRGDPRFRDLLRRMRLPE